MSIQVSLPGYPNTTLDDCATTVATFGGESKISEIEIPGSVVLPPSYQIFQGFGLNNIIGPVSVENVVALAQTDLPPVDSVARPLASQTDYVINQNTITMVAGLPFLSLVTIMSTVDGNIAWLWHPVKGTIIPAPIA